MYDYDVVIIGAGSAGLVACKPANGLGKKVAFIEKRKIGGDCTWFGLAATIVVTVFVISIARKALREAVPKYAENKANG